MLPGHVVEQRPKERQKWTVSPLALELGAIRNSLEALPFTISVVNTLELSPPTPTRCLDETGGERHQVEVLVALGHEGRTPLSVDLDRRLGREGQRTRLKHVVGREKDIKRRCVDDLRVRNGDKSTSVSPPRAAAGAQTRRRRTDWKTLLRKHVLPSGEDRSQILTIVQPLGSERGSPTVHEAGRDVRRRTVCS